MERKAYHVVIDQNDDRELVFNLTQPNRILDAIVASGHMASWSFVSAPTPEREFMVYVYHGLSVTIPQGENLEEINLQAVKCILASE
jgi:hypothetical protein